MNENLEALKKGIVNLEKHIENIQKFGVPVIVTLNSFVTDTPEAEYAFVKEFCEERDCEFALAEVWEKGGEGGVELAEEGCENTGEPKKAISTHCMQMNFRLTEKIETIAKEIYGARRGYLSNMLQRNSLQRLRRWDLVHFPVCMAKNQYSLSDDAKLLGRPERF